MFSTEVTVIDYGMGNLLSVCRGLEHIGAVVQVTADPERILAADRVVLPGVGAFPDAMDELKTRGLISVIRDVANSGTPLLGICLGMQILFDSGKEFGNSEGLGLIPGDVCPIPGIGEEGYPHKIPHIGWSSIYPASGTSWAGTLLADVSPGDATYFVHSYMAQPLDDSFRIANCMYGGIAIAAVVAKSNVVGCQFHPEKSGDVGLRILRRFMLI